MLSCQIKHLKYAQSRANEDKNAFFHLVSSLKHENTHLNESYCVSPGVQDIETQNSKMTNASYRANLHQSQNCRMSLKRPS